MSSTAPLPPPARRAWGPWVVVIGLLAILAWLVFSGVGNALVYYQTPTELAARGDAAVGQAGGRALGGLRLAFGGGVGTFLSGTGRQGEGGEQGDGETLGGHGCRHWGRLLT